SSVFGRVKGWCTATQRCVSASWASSGKSTTHRKFSAVLPWVSSHMLAISTRTRPRISQASCQVPA
ncbi:MAG: hypothetical protein ACK55Z_29205, partial [bacterium]